MKKYIFILLTLALISAGCAYAKPTPTLEPPPPPPPPPSLFSAPADDETKIDKPITIKKGDTGASVISVDTVPGEVTTVEQLQALANAVIAKNENVKLIKLTPEGVEGEYNYRGRLLGIIPVKAYAKFSVRNNGSTEIKMPWYHIFIKKSLKLDDRELEKEIKEKNIGSDISRRANSLKIISKSLGTN